MPPFLTETDQYFAQPELMAVLRSERIMPMPPRHPAIPRKEAPKLSPREVAFAAFCDAPGNNIQAFNAAMDAYEAEMSDLMRAALAVVNTAPIPTRAT